MVPVICLNDTLRPHQVPENLWIKQGEWYHITEIALCKPQNIDGFSLYEKPLGDNTAPYYYFRAARFGIREADIPALKELAEQCNELDGLDVGALVDSVINENMEVV